MRAIRPVTRIVPRQQLAAGRGDERPAGSAYHRRAVEGVRQRSSYADVVEWPHAGVEDGVGGVGAGDGVEPAAVARGERGDVDIPEGEIGDVGPPASDRPHAPGKLPTELDHDLVRVARGPGRP